MFAELAGAGLSIGGDLIAQNQQRIQNQKNADLQYKMFKKNMAAQKEFAQHGVQWKTADAKAAGIHPLYAMGANTTSFSPISVQTDQSAPMADFAKNMGQDLSRAAYSVADRAQKAQVETSAALNVQSQKLQNEGLQLENEMKRSQLARMSQQTGPALPSSRLQSAIPGQGDATNINGASINPVQLGASDPGRPEKEAGIISNYTFQNTGTGLTPSPSNDWKQRNEDNFIQESMWAIRNNLLPNFGAGPKPPDPKLYPPPKGYNGWSWSHAGQEFRPSKNGNFYLGTPKDRRYK